MTTALRPRLVWGVRELLVPSWVMTMLMPGVISSCGWTVFGGNVSPGGRAVKGGLSLRGYQSPLTFRICLNSWTMSTRSLDCSMTRSMSL